MSAVYAYLNTDPTNGICTAQEDVYGSLNIQLTDRWSVAAAMRYDIDADQIASDMFQVRYADECFVLTATYTDNYYFNPDIVDGQTLMLRFELKHLGEFGYSTDVLSGTSSASSSRAVNLVAVPLLYGRRCDAARVSRTAWSQAPVRATGPPMFASINRRLRR